MLATKRIRTYIKVASVFMVLGLPLAMGGAITIQPNLAHAMSQLRVNDVIKMARAGLPDSLIISKIRSTRSIFSLSVDDMIRLKKNGVSDKIIEEMVQTETNKGPVVEYGGVGGCRPSGGPAGN